MDREEAGLRQEVANIYRNEFVSIIRARLGININSSQMDTLLHAIVTACDKFDCEPLELLDRLKVEAVTSPAIDYISSNITIGETYFFRDKRQMKLLEEYVLPSIIKEKRADNNPVIRLWSAGCSSGEEIYTLAMMLLEMIPDHAQWNIFLMGTDINSLQIKKAMAGIYSEWSMRSISPYYKNKYFSFDGNKYHIADKVKSMVEFLYLNLNDDLYPSILNNTNAHDLILCRNVLIYFDDHSINKFMAKVGLCLTRNGFLMLGASDPININSDKLTKHTEHASLFVNSMANPESVVSKVISDEYEVVENVGGLIGKSAPITRKLSSSHTKKEAKTNNPIDLANQGKLQEAANEYISLIKSQKTDKQLYLDFAVTLIELNRLNEAEEALKKAIFLDNRFVMAHFQLGMLMIRNNRKEIGLKSLQNALDIAKSQSPDATVPGNPGMQYKRLAEILEKEILIFHE